jgi:Domain of unknown function (DUF4145)
MSNFDFLKSHSRHLAHVAGKAEEHVYSDPSACAGALRYVADVLARETTVKLGLHPAKDEKGHITFHNQLIAIRNARVAPKEIIDCFFDIKNSGNEGVHQYNTTIEDAKALLQSTYEISAWFMREIKHWRNSIPSFVLPEPSSANGADPTWKRFLGTRTGKWTAGILAALGITFGYHLATDEDHRWNVALVRTVRIVVFVLILALLALPFFVLANGMTIWQAYHLFVSSIAEKLGWSEYLIHALGLALLLPFSYSVRVTFSGIAKRRLAGMAALVAMAIGYNLMFYYATKDTPFIFSSGRGAKYYERTDQGIVLYDRAGYSPTTGQPLLPVTPEVWRDYQIELKQGEGSMVSIDPATHDWFNPNSGAPMLWYSRSSDGKFQFFPRPGINPRTGDPLSPVTRELEQNWTEARTPKPPTPVTQQDILSQILHPAASGGPGVLLLDVTANDQNGVDALNRNLSGVNTSAFPATALARRGFAAKLYQGDAGLVRKALAITHLKSLVVAEVKTECAKRTALDSDLLSCDLTANARRFDSQGNPAGSQMVHATGAGFNESAALEAAANRASASFLAFAKR